VARRAGYGYVETPAFEDTATFKAWVVGESSDIVTKRCTPHHARRRSLTLRPEGTASVVRAVLQHNLDRARYRSSCTYSGSFYGTSGRRGPLSALFAGRPRGVGRRRPLIDVELITLAADAYKDLGLRQVRLLLNTLGDKECRPVYRARCRSSCAGWTSTRTPAPARDQPAARARRQRPEVRAGNPRGPHR